MKNLWNFHLDRQQKNQQNHRALRIIEDLHKSIEYFNTTNICTPKFGYSSINFTVKASEKIERTENQSFRNGMSERNSVDDKAECTANQEAKDEKDRKKSVAKASLREIKKVTWTHAQEHNKENLREKSTFIKTFSIRHIKGIVFRDKKSSKGSKTAGIVKTHA